MEQAFHEHPLYTREGRQHPFSIYTKLRSDEPLTKLVEPMRRLPLWLFTRYDDCVAILKDPRFGKDNTKLSEAERERSGYRDELAMLGRHLLGVDPPDHTRLRALVAKAFTPARIDGLRPRIKEIAEELVDRVEKQGHMEVVDDYAYDLPVTVIAELLGVPPEDHNRFRSWTRTLMTPPPDGNMDGIKAAGFEFFQYLMGLVESRRVTPTDDLIGALVLAEEDGTKLDTQELISMLFLLLVAGHETTVNLISNGTLALLDNPAELEKLRQDPTLLDSAIEEMLRYCGPVETSTMRFALEDMAYYGQEIKRGDLVIVSLLSAGHDPERFPDGDRFDISRKPNRHIAFGYGIHFCLGAPLARLEATIAFEVLLRRLPNLKLAVPRESLEFRNSILIHAVNSLPVTF
ncbi:MAG TPA: cytochrome P450 [Polyangium sp.]|nr:cytochrome P450 [Polyangium sp.]